jgi:hypothetical protein
MACAISGIPVDILCCHGSQHGGLDMARSLAVKKAVKRTTVVAAGRKKVIA